jgi:hypothetical protein
MHVLSLPDEAALRSFTSLSRTWPWPRARTSRPALRRICTTCLSSTHTRVIYRFGLSSDSPQPPANLLCMPPGHWQSFSIATSCYGYTGNTAESSQSTKCPIPSARYWKSERWKDIHSAKSLRHHRQSRDLQAWTGRNSRAGTFSFPVAAVSISLSSQVELSPTIEVGQLYSSGCR